MKLQMHAFAEPKAFEDYLAIVAPSRARIKQAAIEQTGDVPFAYAQVVRDSIQHACIALLLAKPSGVVAEHWDEAVKFGIGLLDLAPGRSGVRIYEAELKRSERGTELTALHEKPQPRGPHVMSEIDFSYILHVTLPFGDQEQLFKVARYPEEKYRSPGIVGPEHSFWAYNAYKALVRGEEEHAKRQAEAVLAEVERPAMSALLALLARDEAGFEKHLEARLKAHKKQYQKSPKDPLGAVCLDGLGLCRLALDRGLRVEEWPYLPVRLLPNFKGSQAVGAPHGA